MDEFERREEGEGTVGEFFVDEAHKEGEEFVGGLADFGLEDLVGFVVGGDAGFMAASAADGAGGGGFGVGGVDVDDEAGLFLRFCEDFVEVIGYFAALGLGEPVVIEEVKLEDLVFEEVGAATDALVHGIHILLV